jgi:hypothetical protein
MCVGIGWARPSTPGYSVDLGRYEVRSDFKLKQGDAGLGYGYKIDSLTKFQFGVVLGFFFGFLNGFSKP